MGSSKKQIDLTAFKLIGDQYDGVFFVYDLEAEKFIYLNEVFETMWKRKVEEVKDNPASLLESIFPEDIDHVKTHYKKSYWRSTGKYACNSGWCGLTQRTDGFG